MGVVPGHGPVRRAGIFLHRWLGLIIGLVLVLVGLSGTLLAYGDQLKGWMYPAIDGPPPPRAEARRGEVLARINENYAPGEIVVLRFPTAHVAAYEIWLANGQQHYRDALSGDLVLTRDTSSDLLGFASELHIHLLSGETGERILGWLGLAMIVLLGTGLWLWWPRSGLWKIALARPRFGNVVVQWHYWHRTIGAVGCVLLLFVTVTGTALIFYYPAQAILTGLFGGEPPALPRQVAARQENVDWLRVLATLDATFPGARTVFYAPPANLDAPLSFRKKQAQELHPNGRSVVLIQRNGELVAASDATLQGAGLRATQALYPLHAGKAGSETWRFLVALSGLLPLALFVSGGVLWWKRRQVNATP